MPGVVRQHHSKPASLLPDVLTRWTYAYGFHIVWPVMASAGGKTYIVEHLDEELGPWSELEYAAIATESRDAGSKFLLSSLPPAFKVPDVLSAVSAFTAETRGVEELYAHDKSRVCLLDPAAAKDLAPEDGNRFDVFLFGGILGRCPKRVLAFGERHRGLMHTKVMIHHEVSFGEPPCRPVRSQTAARQDLGAAQEGLRGSTTWSQADDYRYCCARHKIGR